VIEINLLPGSRKKRGAKAAAFQMPDVKALLAAVKDPWLIGCVAGWALFALVLAVFYLPRRSQVDELTPRLEAVKNEAMRLGRVLAIKRQFEARRDSLIDQIEKIRAIDRDRYTWPHILDEISRRLPAYTWLDDISARATEGDTSGGQVVSFQITGKSADLQAVTRFLRDLEASPFVENVTTVSTGVVTEQGREVNTFVLNARYQVPDSTILTMQPLSTSLVTGVRSGGGRVR
jgi:Tfp pilus assembly protein PilN